MIAGVAPMGDSGPAATPAKAGSLRITFITISFDPEPGNQHGLPFARWLTARGHKVKVLTTFPQYPHGRVYPEYTVRPWQWETMDGVPVLRVPMYPSHDQSGLRRALTYATFMASATLIGAPLVGGCDVVFLFEPPTNAITALALKHLHGAPIVYHIPDIWPDSVVDSGLLGGGYLQRFARASLGAYCNWTYRESDLISVLSPGFKRLLVERGVPSEKISVVYNWADEKLFHPVERDEALARELGIAGKFTFMYAGNLGPLQDIETLVAAAARLRDVPGLQLAIIGTGPREESVRAAVRSLGATNVVLVPRRPYTEMTRIHALADVLFVHLRDSPLMRVTIPSKTQVAMASGRPVLIAVNGDAAELIAAAGCGVHAQPQDPASIAEAMLSMFRLPRPELERMGLRGRRFYEQQLSLDASGGRIEQLFALAAAGRPGSMG